MVEPAELLGYIRLTLAQNGVLSGKHIIVTAGGTQEPIDPVRAITNRSSGKQGAALAQAALDLGARVTLIAASLSAPIPVGADRIDVRTAEEMLHAVMEAISSADALLMAAAVADFRPASPASHKIKKDSGVPDIILEHTPDILAAVAEHKSKTGYPRVSVGFAAESQDLTQNARKKLQTKKLDLIAANDISADDAGFAVDTNRITLLDASSQATVLPLMSKAQVANVILDRVAALISKV
jgi:phosphopantothenoylcysteine decarboxylase/phosphopantothenate--cysteine ligase